MLAVGKTVNKNSRRVKGIVAIQNYCYKPNFSSPQAVKTCPQWSFWMK
jgi:hypothetical protein